MAQPGDLDRKTPDLTRQGADIESPGSRGFHIPEWQYVCGLSFIVLLTLAAYARIAAFFGVHPQHVEVVAWVSERK